MYRRDSCLRSALHRSIILACVEGDCELQGGLLSHAGLGKEGAQGIIQLEICQAEAAKCSRETRQGCCGAALQS